jgi:LytS/YehU family sensor histidine kinase
VLYWLVPRLLLRSAYVAFFFCYCVWALAGLFLSYSCRYYFIPDSLFGDPASHPAYMHPFTLALDTLDFTVANVMATFAVFIRMYTFWRGEVWHKLQLTQEKTRAELELLKAQLHPHFLFNTLNNLQALVLERSDKAPQMLMRLSAILSYVLYECQDAAVALEREISICRDYIQLESERYGDRLDISMDFSGPIAGKMIAPMLFQPFIENAFQHGPAEQAGKAWMSIELSVRHNHVFFRVINSTDFSARIAGGPDEEIGIQNIRRRLELLYPGRHQLSQERGDGVYIVSLSIDLTPSAMGMPLLRGNINEQALYENTVFNY